MESPVVAASALPPLLATPPFPPRCPTVSALPPLLATPPFPPRRPVPVPLPPVKYGRHWSSVPGRASLSESWVKDKLSGSAASYKSGERKRPASQAPSADRTDKKWKPAAENEASVFAGPTFVISPEPSDVPMPLFPKRSRRD